MDVRRFLRHTIAVAAFTGRDVAGDPTFGPPTTMKARVEAGAEKVVVAGGREVTSTTQVMTLTAIGEHDRVWTDPATTTPATALTPMAVRSADPVRGGARIFMAYL